MFQFLSLCFFVCLFFKFFLCILGVLILFFSLEFFHLLFLQHMLFIFFFFFLISLLLFELCFFHFLFILFSNFGHYYLIFHKYSTSFFCFNFIFSIIFFSASIRPDWELFLLIVDPCLGYLIVPSASSCHIPFFSSSMSNYRSCLNILSFSFLLSSICYHLRLIAAGSFNWFGNINFISSLDFIIMSDYFTP